MIRRTLIYFLLLSAALCFAAPARQNAPAAAPPTQAAKDEGADLVVARVSGIPITEKQVVSIIEQMANQKQVSLAQPQQGSAALFKEAVDNLVITTLLKNQARLLNVTIDKAAVDQRVQQFSQRFSSREEFEKALAGQGLTEPELRKNIEESMGMQEVIDRAVKDVPGASDAEIEKFYNDNPDKFAMPERVHVAHILLRVDPKSTPEQKAEIRKRLEGIRADIESKQITFADAAAKFSQDPSNAQKGGDLGFFARGQMVKPFEDAAFALTPGSLSPVVETQYGYHLIQGIEQKPAGKASLEEVKPAIKQYLDQMAKQRVLQKYVNDLRAQATIENFMTQEEFAKRHPAK